MANNGVYVLFFFCNFRILGFLARQKAMPTQIDVDGYTIIRKIGTGARSTIYLVKDDITGESVALKRAHLDAPEDVRIFEQIETEFKVSKHIDHPYIRKCIKITKHRKLLRVNEVLMTMEMFDGKSLEESPGLSLGDILLVFRMVAAGLNAMHQAGYVHCDIKPNNILISPKGGIKIIDLGQSCKMGTIKPRIQGTPDYIAPEQVRREHLSHRTDIFNLGATMYWALTGKNIPTLIPKKVGLGVLPVGKKKVKTPHEIYKKIPIEVSDMVMSCIQDKPADRPSNMAAIMSCFDTLLRQIFSKSQTNAPTDN
jgi:serine/threonine protein kinase